MPDYNNSNIRPAQVLLTANDREAMATLQSRVAGRGVPLKGPTPVFRAGLRLLGQLSDNELAAVFASLDERPSLDMIQEQFAQWCSTINDQVCGAEIALQCAWGAAGGDTDVGTFRYQGRFVHVSLMQDGRVLISGLEAVTRPIGPGAPMPRASQLFPGGLATMLSMNSEGAALARRAIVGWLTCDDDAVNQLRADIRKHRADPLI